jgi:hypothetical protein
MGTIQVGDQVATMAPDRETIEVFTVVKVLPDGVQVDGASGKLPKAELRVFSEDTVNRIREKESQLRTIKREIGSLYDTLGRVD